MQQDIFTSNGGQYITTPAQLKQRLHHVHALLFDWDGVFNSGEKGEVPSSFSEVDSMGINMLRFGYFMLTGKIPYTAIVTGETNQTAFKWAARERLDNVFFQVKHKADMISWLREQHDIQPDNLLFVFDDVLDLSLAAEAGARFLVNRQANPLFNAYCIKNNLCDYLTFSSGRDNALREISEVVLDAIGQFDATIRERIAFDGIYSEFLKKKTQKTTTYLQSAHRSFEVKDIQQFL